MGNDIRTILVERRRELLEDIFTTIRHVRSDGSLCDHRLPDHEDSEAVTEDDLTFVLMQMKAQSLQRINDAIRKLDEGTYGWCTDCESPIAESRLRALPFAARCKHCEEIREKRYLRPMARRNCMWSHSAEELSSC